MSYATQVSRVSKKVEDIVVGDLVDREQADVPDPAVKVRSAKDGGQWTEWNISLNLTDRWGDINEYDAANKPLAALEQAEGLLERLREQMCDEMTFIVRKDGKFGLLYEEEFCSQESEGGAGDSSLHKPHAVVIMALLEGMAKLVERFPGVEFAVPRESEVIDDRPAAWAFVEDGLLDESRRTELAAALRGL